jgi:hypothetical protein
MKVDATWVGHSRAGYSNCGVRSWRNNVLFQRRHSQLNGLMQSFKLLNDEEHRDARKMFMSYLKNINRVHLMTRKKHYQNSSQVRMI